MRAAAADLRSDRHSARHNVVDRSRRLLGRCLKRSSGNALQAEAQTHHDCPTNLPALVAGTQRMTAK